MSIVDALDLDLEGLVEDLYDRAGARRDEAWLPSTLAEVLGVPVDRVANLKALAKLEPDPYDPERRLIQVRRTLPPEIAEWAVGHELGHWAGLTDERACNYVGAALLLRRRPFLAALRSGEDWATIAEAFGTTSTSAVLRAGELEGRPLAVVTPGRVYARGVAEWPDEGTIRRWARQGGPGIRRAVLRDDPRRIVIEGLEDEG